jgi:hypothetical protein
MAIAVAVTVEILAIWTVRLSDGVGLVELGIMLAEAPSVQARPYQPAPKLTIIFLSALAKPVDVLLARHEHALGFGPRWLSCDVFCGERGVLRLERLPPSNASR